MSVRIHVALMSAFLGLCWGALAGWLTDWITGFYSLVASPFLGVIAGELSRRYRLYEGVRSIFGGLGLLSLTSTMYGIGSGLWQGGPHIGALGAVCFVWLGTAIWVWLLWPLAALSTYLIGWTIRQVTP